MFTSPCSRVSPRLTLAAAAALIAATPASAPGECARLDDPLQVIEIRLEMDPGDWEVVRFDDSAEIEVPATFRACDEAPLRVRVRRKVGDLLSDGDDHVKVSLKIDFDDLVPDREWHGHRKLSLEAGRGLGRGTLLREAFAWQVLRRAGVIAGGAAWVRVSVNGEPIGVYARVEQVDKSYLRRHLGEDEGFLYKLDYRSPGDIRRRLTREGEPDPYAANLCYPPFDVTCEEPPGARGRLALHLDQNQILLLAAVNALIVNYDSPFYANNNYFWYNSERPRLYFPWDLDLALLTGLESIDPHDPLKDSAWNEFFFADPALREAFDLHLARLVDDALPPEVLERFLDELAPAIGPAIEADPRSDVDVSFANEVAKLRAFIRTRAAFVRSRLPAESREPWPIVINEVMASNDGVVADEGKRYPDWVELYNRSAEMASLTGLFLSDDPAEPRKWRLPDEVLPPRGRLLIWCDHDAGVPLHTGFRLDAEGDAVALYQVPDRAPAGLYRLVDFVRFGPQETDVALGRFPDGSPGLVKLRCPTPGAPNRESCAGEGARFLRGDQNGDGALDLSDPIGVLLGLFLGAGIPCADAADADDDGSVDLNDAVVLLARLFLGGAPPPEPRSGCGRDPTPDGLGCADAERCR